MDGLERHNAPPWRRCRHVKVQIYRAFCHWWPVGRSGQLPACLNNAWNQRVCNRSLLRGQVVVHVAGQDLFIPDTRHERRYWCRCVPAKQANSICSRRIRNVDVGTGLMAVNVAHRKRIEWLRPRGELWCPNSHERNVCGFILFQIITTSSGVIFAYNYVPAGCQEGVIGRLQWMSSMSLMSCLVVMCYEQMVLHVVLMIADGSKN